MVSLRNFSLEKNNYFSNLRLKGDGGSGLMCDIGGRYQVVGLVAWGIGCATANVPGVYVKVQNFLTWIQQNQF